MYQRPGEAYACFTRGPVPVFSHMAPRDDSDSTHYCVKADSIGLAAKLTYYAAKAMRDLEKKVPPVP